MKKAFTSFPWRVAMILLLAVVGGWLLGLEAFGRPAATAAPKLTGWPTLSLTEVVTGLDDPVHITHAGDGSGRLFVVERAGRIRIIKDGALVSTPFLDISARVGSQGSEQGLLSVAFPPAYATDGAFYVNYTDTAGDTVVARYRVTANPDVADPNSEEIVLTVDQPYGNHNGGQLAFGPNDGYLYIGMGDGGSAGDPQNYAQDPNSLLGKMLRVDPVTTDTYTIPPDNPFVDDPGTRDEIWALGLRNPWRFSFDRQTADLYIGDVGQGSYEEIDFQPASSTGGENYGWRCKEGFHDFNMSGDCPSLTLEPPIREYDHSQGCSVTGGFVYRGLNYCTMQRVYLYGDFCSGRIWGLQREGSTWENQLLLDTTLNISTFGEDEAGNLYVADYTEGKVYMLTAGTPAIYPDLTDPPGIGVGDVQAAAARWRQRPGNIAPPWMAASTSIRMVT